MKDKKTNELDKKQLNDLVGLSKHILKILYFLIIMGLIYALTIIFKEWKILNFIQTIFSILSPLFLGIVVAWLLNPFVKWLENKNVRRTLGTIFSYVILISGFILLIKAIIPLLYNQTLDLASNFPNIFSDIKTWIENGFNNLNSITINFEDIEKNIFEKIDILSNSLSTSLPAFIVNTFTSIISYIGTFIIGLVIGFYLLLSWDNLGNMILDIIPKRIQPTLMDIGKKIESSLRDYVNGALLDSFVVFVISSIVFAIAGLKAPLLFGLFCGLMNVIPYAGPYIGGAPAVIVAFSESTGLGIAILISIVIIQMLEGNILQTLIISKTTKLNPVIIIIGLLIFGHFFGIIGMLLSTPILGVVKVIIKYIDEKYDFLNFN